MKCKTTSDSKHTRGKELSGYIVGSHSDPLGKTVYQIALDGERDGEAVYLDGVRYPRLVFRNAKRVEYPKQNT